MLYALYVYRFIVKLIKLPSVGIILMLVRNIQFKTFPGIISHPPPPTTPLARHILNTRLYPLPQPKKRALSTRHAATSGDMLPCLCLCVTTRNVGAPAKLLDLES